jgi:hypothetical protein
MEKSLESHKKTVSKLENLLLSRLETVDVVDLDIQLDEARTKCAHISDTLQRRKAALGVDHRAMLTRLTNNAFLRIRMNARALKKRLRDRLRQRKFELERLERAYRHTINRK